MDSFKNYNQNTKDYTFIYQANRLSKTGHIMDLPRETPIEVVQGVFCLLFNQNMLSISRRFLVLETNLYNPPSDTLMAT